MACETCGVLRCQIIRLEDDLKHQKDLNEAMSDALHKMANDCQCKLGEVELARQKVERKLKCVEAGLVP